MLEDYASKIETFYHQALERVWEKHLTPERTIQEALWARKVSF